MGVFLILKEVSIRKDFGSGLYLNTWIMWAENQSPSALNLIRSLFSLAQIVISYDKIVISQIKLFFHRLYHCLLLYSPIIIIITFLFQRKKYLFKALTIYILTGILWRLQFALKKKCIWSLCVISKKGLNYWGQKWASRGLPISSDSSPSYSCCVIRDVKSNSLNLFFFFNL